ncbi:WXG100 family type VII secretion target [Aldersonia kunmingensis]|uniref:WXG100 family type VII secretion target n=1 Tax=Aldersonia kunmingensis TaxID=408066 RepID=UPI000835AD16|nr:WXG100 family type VII secretion target [Aldersonia kunmingensis]
MSEQVRVEPDALRAVAPRFAELSDAVESARQTLASALSAEGECWGADESGESFAKGYADDVSPTVDAIASLVTVLDSIRQRLVTTADNYDATDSRTAVNLDGIG